MPNSGMVTSRCYYLDGQRGRWGERTEWYKNMQFGEEKCMKQQTEHMETNYKQLVRRQGWDRNLLLSSKIRKGTQRGDCTSCSLWIDLREPEVRMPWEGFPSWKNCLEKFLQRLCLKRHRDSLHLWSKLARLHLELTGLANIIHIVDIL